MEPNHQERARFDQTKRRRSQRQGKQRGITITIPAAQLREAGIDPDGPPPQFRTWASERGSILVRLYRPPA